MLYSPCGLELLFDYNNNWEVNKIAYEVRFFVATLSNIKLNKPGILFVKQFRYKEHSLNIIEF